MPQAAPTPAIIMSGRARSGTTVAATPPPIDGISARTLTPQVPAGPISDLLIDAIGRSTQMGVIRNQCTPHATHTILGFDTSTACLIYAGCTNPDTLTAAIANEDRPLPKTYALFNPHLPWNQQASRCLHDVPDNDLIPPLRLIGWRTVTQYQGDRPELIKRLSGLTNLTRVLATALNVHEDTDGITPSDYADLFGPQAAGEVAWLLPNTEVSWLLPPGRPHAPNSFDLHNSMPTADEVALHHVQDQLSYYAWRHLGNREAPWHLLLQLMRNWDRSFADLIATVEALT